MARLEEAGQDNRLKSRGLPVPDSRRYALIGHQAYGNAQFKPLADARLKRGNSVTVPVWAVLWEALALLLGCVAMRLKTFRLARPREGRGR